jgi:ATP/maltotriose-dependent transcriptional regulator MalT
MPVGRSVDPFLEAKLHWPPLREGWVQRDRLLERFDRATRRPVLLVAAPAGYGKTTLVAQWLAARRGSRDVAWVSLDAGDNDPGRLWTHVAAALGRAGCVLASDSAAFTAADSGDLIAGGLTKMVHALASMSDDIVIILDDFHFVQEPACHDQVGFLIGNLPPQAHLVIVSRSDPGLRLGRLRASGLLAEIRADELSFTIDEAASLLALEDVDLPGAGVADLVGRTEGWPAGLYLATLSLSGRTDASEVVSQLSGNNRYIGGYLTEEVLNQHPKQVRELILMMSILDRFCGSLCDFVAETSDAAEILQGLERENLFLVPLDDERRWFRFHHLFAAVARSELEAAHGERVPELHLRAADWFRRHDHIDEAVAHLLAAGRHGEASALVQANWMAYVDAGRGQTVLSWLASLGSLATLTDPAAGVTAAWMAALVGDEPALIEHLEALKAFGEHGPLPDGTRSVESAISMIQGLFGFGGPVEMLSSAKRAVELETDGRSPHYAVANLALGHAAYVAGDVDDAVPLLIRASHSEAAPAIVRVLGLSMHSLVEGELGHHERSRLMAERAMDIVESRDMYAMPQVSMAFTALGQVLARAGKLSDAVAILEQGLALRRRQPGLAPWATIHHLMVMSRVAVEAGDLVMAQDLLDELAARVAHFSDGMRATVARLAAVRSEFRARSSQDAHEEPLTARELDILRLLQGSLSLSEIADELHLSSNTVKTHTQAIYRKLGAHSRKGAVAIARRERLV